MPSSNKLIQGFLIIEDGEFSFIINDAILDDYDKTQIVLCQKIRLFRQLIKGLLLYGFSFTTYYDVRQLTHHLKTNLSQDKQNYCNQWLQQHSSLNFDNQVALIRTSISLDADNMNQIALYCYECLDEDFYDAILTVHYDLINQLVVRFRQHIDQQFNFGFTIIELCLVGLVIIRLLLGASGLDIVTVFILGLVYGIVRENLKKWFVKFVLKQLITRIKKQLIKNYRD